MVQIWSKQGKWRVDETYGGMIIALKWSHHSGQAVSVPIKYELNMNLDYFPVLQTSTFLPYLIQL